MLLLKYLDFLTITYIEKMLAKKKR